MLGPRLRALAVVVLVCALTGAGYNNSRSVTFVKNSVVVLRVLDLGAAAKDQLATQDVNDGRLLELWHPG